MAVLQAGCAGWVCWQQACDLSNSLHKTESLSLRHPVYTSFALWYSQWDTNVWSEGTSMMSCCELIEFLPVDDMATGAPTEEKMQKGVDQVSDTCDSYVFIISIKKTEVVYQPAPRKPYKEPNITVKGQWLQVIDEFIYLRSTLSRVVHIDDEVNVRIDKASAAFGRLRGSFCDRIRIRLDTKLKIYEPVVMPTLLYACETLTFYQWHAKRLNNFIQALLENF